MSIIIIIHVVELCSFTATNGAEENCGHSVRISLVSSSPASRVATIRVVGGQRSLWL